MPAFASPVRCLAVMACCWSLALSAQAAEPAQTSPAASTVPTMATTATAAPALTAEQVKAFCKDNLTGYKQPRMVEFRTELPKSNVGKILRRELRDAPQPVT